MTNQELYDTVRMHLLTQMKQSLSVRAGGCSYRGEDGLKCAIGCLIPDDKYSESLEGFSPQMRTVAEAAGLEYSPEGETHATGPQIDLASGLQAIHDNDDPDQWLARLDAFARENGLAVQS